MYKRDRTVDGSLGFTGSQPETTQTRDKSHSKQTSFRWVRGLSGEYFVRFAGTEFRALPQNMDRSLSARGGEDGDILHFARRYTVHVRRLGRSAHSTTLQYRVFEYAINIQ